MTDPERVLVAGDWHSNAEWAVGVIEQLPKLLPDEPEPLILHAGDFGIWPGHAGERYLRDVHAALADVGARLWFVDGNHEDHGRLYRIGKAVRGKHRVGFHYGRDDEDTRLFWLTRGHRWTWHDRTWLALGGATSVDRTIRTTGKNWWAGEAITERDARAAIDPGRADVMLTHDCPDNVPMPLPAAPDWWEMGPAHEHRELLGRVVDEVRPSWLIHGHYHLTHQQTVQRDYGPLQVTGLDMDGALRGNYRVLNVRDMTWETT